MSSSRHGAFSFNYAVVCRLARSFVNRQLLSDTQLEESEHANGQPDDETNVESEHNDGEPAEETSSSQQSIDYEKARAEHQGLIEALRKCNLNVLELPEDEDYKDSCCVEDCAVVIGGTALITSPGLASRRGETKAIRRVLEADLKMNIEEIRDGTARLDGGDVLFTGKEIFVGIGKQSNEQGAQAVAGVFLDYVVVPINIGNLSCRHLKNICSMVANQVIAISNSSDGEQLFKLIKENAQYSYALLKMDTDEAANMIFVNGHLIHRTREEINDTSYSVLDEKIDPHGRHEVSIRELERAGVTLTSLVLLVNKQRTAKKLISNLQDEDLDRYASTEFVKKFAS